MDQGTQTSELEQALDDFLNYLTESISNPQKIEKLLRGEYELKSSDIKPIQESSQEDIGTLPEEWIEDALIDNVLDAVGLTKVPGRLRAGRKGGGEEPDFGLNQECGLIIGENKAPNNIKQAEKELIDEYLSREVWPRYGIATDGFEWIIYRKEKGGDFIDYQKVREISLRDALTEKSRQRGIISQSELGSVNLVEELEQFTEIFNPKRLVPLLTQKAPKEFQDKRTDDVEDFYKLYVELIFGESEDYDEEYETCLRNDIRKPDGASPKERDVFAVELVNRLLFIKFLEKHEVIPEGFLVESIEEFDTESPRTLYDSRIKPLFYRVFNTPKDGRNSEVRGGVYEEIPYLNGGLFRPTLDQEEKYNVETNILKTVIEDLVEGKNLDFELDPAILGSVFEKTINHLGAEEDRQKDLGAYYTPNDVTQKITENTIDEKLKDAIIEAFTGNVDQETTFRSETSDMSLEEILRHIENGSGYFQSISGLKEAESNISEIKILDPACGSGHFLTSAMEEIYQVRQSIKRGLNGGDKPSDAEKFEIKKQIALNSIYGVDVDAVAVEIAKLRVWLKIVESNSWESSFSQLPNIDVNILAGNSLVGLPVKSEGQSKLSDFNIDVDEIQEIRKAYRNEQISRQELRQKIEDKQSNILTSFLGRLNHYVEDEITSSLEFETIAGDSNLYPKFKKITVRRPDRNTLTDSQRKKLEEKGFKIEPRAGKSAKIEGEEISNFTGPQIAPISDEFNLEVERRVTKADLEEIEFEEDASYGAFHWVIQFPEAAEEKGGNEYDIQFDVVLGNPPYGGEVLSREEKLFLDSFNASTSNIVYPFIERQLQLLSEDGYFGNIHSMGVLYAGSADTTRELMEEKLTDTNIACFGHRPSTIFKDANPRAAITTGKKNEEEKEPLNTSDWILFYSENRAEAFSNIEYESTEDLVLGNSKIGGEGNSAAPKVGDPTSRDILLSLKDFDRTIGDVGERNNPETRDHPVYRDRHPLYWIHPYFENLYGDGSTSQDFEPIFFQDELIRRFVFITMQSSLFYRYWMAYENQMDLNWGPLEAFPVPPREVIESSAEEIRSLSETLWNKMDDDLFTGEGIENGAELKPIVDDIEDLIGPMYGLSNEEISYLKNYHTEFGRGCD